MDGERFDRVVKAFNEVRVPRRGVFGVLAGMGALFTAYRLMFAQPYCIPQGGSCTLFIRCCEGLICYVGYNNPNVGQCVTGTTVKGAWFAFPGMLTPMATGTVRPTRHARRKSNKNHNNRNQNRKHADATSTAQAEATSTAQAKGTSTAAAATSTAQVAGTQTAVAATEQARLTPPAGLQLNVEPIDCDGQPERTRVTNNGSTTAELSKFESLENGKSVGFTSQSLKPNESIEILTYLPSPALVDSSLTVINASSEEFFPGSGAGRGAEMQVIYRELIYRFQGYCS